jgi:phosphoribosyl-AMP cyclohydrolase
VLYRVKPKGQGACHVKDEQGIARTGCYYRKIVDSKILEKIKA